MKQFNLLQEHLAKARLIRDRVEMLEHLPKNAIVCEVGTREGHFSRKILDTCQPKELHLIDRNWARFERQHFLQEIDSGQVRLYNRDSARGLKEFEDGYFDWIYIDGDHRYPGVKRDIAAAITKVKPDGLLCFNDYTRWTRRGTEYGVIPAVNQLCVEENWNVAFLALHKGGYNDIVLQKRH